MKMLLDTHVLIWSQELPQKLGPAQQFLLDPSNELFVSAVSVLEIGQLIYARRLSIQGGLSPWLQSAAQCLPLQFIGMDHDLASEAYRLPEPFHKDPADRILVATARTYRLVLLTADRRLVQYPHVNTVPVDPV